MAASLTLYTVPLQQYSTDQHSNGVAQNRMFIFKEMYQVSAGRVWQTKDETA